MEIFKADIEDNVSGNIFCNTYLDYKPTEHIKWIKQKLSATPLFQI